MSSCPQASAIWTELSRRGLGIRELAAALGYNPHFCTLVVNGWSDSQRARRRIEALLLTPVWASPEEFAARVPLIEFFGDDIDALTKEKLVKLCAKHRLLGRRRTGLLRSDLLARLTSHFQSTRPKT